MVSLKPACLPACMANADPAAALGAMYPCSAEHTIDAFACQEGTLSPWDGAARLSIGCVAALPLTWLRPEPFFQIAGAWHSSSIESPCWSTAPRDARRMAEHVCMRCRLMRSFGSWALPFLLNAFIIVFYFVAGELHGND